MILSCLSEISKYDIRYGLNEEYNKGAMRYMIMFMSYSGVSYQMKTFVSEVGM